MAGEIFSCCHKWQQPLGFLHVEQSLRVSCNRLAPRTYVKKPGSRSESRFFADAPALATFQPRGPTLAPMAQEATRATPCSELYLAAYRMLNTVFI
jgi:hypothetical protein